MAKTYTVRSKGGGISFQFSKRTFLILLLKMVCKLTSAPAVTANIIPMIIYKSLRFFYS
ncbi:hypothetical protein V7175_01985 [Bacillus altitudinis]|uniref:hypothetical protein n=1 Tax=Bacillus altitudinis TaxID=293387 RepID=UPI002FFE168E